MTMDFGTWSGVEHELVINTHGINVSNMNAGVILRALELPMDAGDGGQLEIAEFRKHLDRAESEWAPGDEGDPGFSEANYHYMGRRPGYLNERFEQLREMLDAGERLGHRYAVWF